MKVVFFPFNGNSIEAFDCVNDDIEVVAFVDDAPEKKDTNYCDIPILSRAELKDGDLKWIALPGSPTTFKNRKKLIASLNLRNEQFTQIISPKASIGKKTKIGYNTLVMTGSVLTSNSIIGNHCIILPNAIIHHDSTLGDYSIVGSNVTIAGNVTVGNNVYIGSGSRIKNGITIGEGALIGMGSNVIKDVPANTTYIGNPAKELIKT